MRLLEWPWTPDAAPWHVMYHEGYRVARERGSHHLIVQQFTEAKFAGDFTADVINIFGHASRTYLHADSRSPLRTRMQNKRKSIANMIYREPSHMQLM